MFSIQEESESDQVSVSPVQHQAQLLAALQARDLDSFSRLLQQFPVAADGACLESACRNADCAQFVRLLLQHGVDPNTLNPVLLKTPLHITAELGYYGILQVLLQDGRICINSLTGSGQTALHVAVNKCGEACTVDVEKYRRCIILLLDWPSNVREWTAEVTDPQRSLDVNAMDWLGNTALHYAAQKEDQETVLILLEHGSYIGSRNHAGDMPISGIEPETLEKFFDTRLQMPNDESLLFKYDFLVPAPDLDSALMNRNLLFDRTDDGMMTLISPSPEMDPVVYISESSKLCHLLVHPVLSSFIHLKWQRGRNLYYYHLTFYVIFVLLLTFIILHHYVTAHHEHNPSCRSNFTAACFFKIIAVVLLVICCLCLIMKILFHLAVSPVQYLCKWDTYPHFFLTLLAFIVAVSNWGVEVNALAAITLFLAWTQLLFLTGEHPAISIYFHLFKKISCTFLTFLAWSSLLIVAFSLSFYVLLHDSKTSSINSNLSSTLFHNPLSSLFTTVCMFVGGFEAMLLLFDSAAGTIHIIFILFVFLLSLVLLNIFVGLAVRKIQKVESKAELLLLRARVNAVSDTERVLLRNPLYVHLQMRRLFISRNALIACIVKLSVYVWLFCNRLQCFRNLHRSVILFPDSSFQHANILFPFGSRSKVICRYMLDHKVLLQAATIVQRKDVKVQQLECKGMISSFQEHLNNIEASLVRGEALQRDVLQLLRPSEASCLQIE
jgi:ankyrin repeat protein